MSQIAEVYLEEQQAAAEKDLERQAATTLPAVREEQTFNVALINRARAFRIECVEDRNEAEAIMKELSDREKFWDKLTGDSKAKAYEAYQSALRLHDDPIKELQDARLNKATGLKQHVIVWDQEQERIRLAEQRRLEEKARKRAEEEQIAAALQAEAEGDAETAQAIIAEPVYVPPVVVPREPVQKSRLTAGRENWNAQVTDLMALVRAVAAGTASINYLEANMTALNQIARAQKSTMSVPGVKAVMTRV
jgi:hypothetical protein